MGTQREQMKGVLHWLVRWGCRAGTRDFCSALAASVSPEQNIIFLTIHYFNSFVHIARQESAVSYCVSLGITVIKIAYNK
jgi:hypothetical protein